MFLHGDLINFISHTVVEIISLVVTQGLHCQMPGVDSYSPARYNGSVCNKRTACFINLPSSPSQLLWEGYCVFLRDGGGKEHKYMVRNNVFSRLEPFHTHKNVPSGKQNQDANVIPHLLPSIFSDIS